MSKVQDASARAADLPGQAAAMKGGVLTHVPTHADQVLDLLDQARSMGGSPMAVAFVDIVGQMVSKAKEPASAIQRVRTILRHESIRRAGADKRTDLGRVLAMHNLSLMVADGPNAASLDAPILFALEQDDRGVLLVPPNSELDRVLAYVGECSPEWDIKRAAGLPAWPMENSCSKSALHSVTRDCTESESNPKSRGRRSPSPALAPDGVAVPRGSEWRRK